MKSWTPKMQNYLTTFFCTKKDWKNSSIRDLVDQMGSFTESILFNPVHHQTTGFDSISQSEKDKWFVSNSIKYLDKILFAYSFQCKIFLFLVETWQEAYDILFCMKSDNVTEYSFDEYLPN